MISAKTMADYVSKVELKKRTPLTKLIRTFYKDREDTVDAIPILIDFLKKEGYFR